MKQFEVRFRLKPAQAGFVVQNGVLTRSES